jgi:hypothetical protein
LCQIEDDKKKNKSRFGGAAKSAEPSKKPSLGAKRRFISPADDQQPNHIVK